ncbi:glycosyltransferase family 2 protein [Ketobacter sp. MCCC 1A13808]|uniref:glycosyltransferase n=1 Tax=Ketobacter sp. MCCC 1A13808 TaxID=2602738 RepID=UPI0012EB0714|nr:glycosyltransferase family A protein [Ketobacter sp. MCCC 1A13808]MVF11156.1 glycosyltransferase family 2 protein [Ketobacter sp. MCCC 1A13808]
MNKLNFSNPANASLLSIIIPVYKDLAGLSDTIGSIKACHGVPGFELEIIVVNDGADPDISQFCRTEKLVEVSINPNRGSYFARNRGIECSHGSLIGFVDADIFVDRQWIVNAVQKLDTHDYVGGSIQVIREGVSETVADYQQLIDFNTRWHMSSIHYAPTANVWVRRSLLEKLGGFEESLFSGGDMEMGRRVYDEGSLQQTYADEVVVRHPPRDLKGLFAKSKRLAYGHNVIGNASKLQSEFTLIQSVKRNLSKGDDSRKLPILVNILRVTLYAHRLLFKVYYKHFLKDAEFQTVVNGTTKVDMHDYR